MNSSGSNKKAWPVVVITGANGNLGRVVVDHFLTKGFQVVALVRKKPETAPLPSSLQYIDADLTDEKQTAAAVAEILQKHQEIAALFCLAGGFAAGALEGTAVEDIRSQIALNFETAYNVVRPVFLHMMGRNSGRIVLIAARPAVEAFAGKTMVAYGLSKSLLLRLAEYLNAEAKGKDVTTTVIIPSTIDTIENRKAKPDADPAKWVKPEDIAALLEFILSAAASPLRQTVLKMYGNG